MARTKVVEVYAGGGVGGAVQHLALLFQTLPREGIDLTLLSLPPHAAAARAAAAGVTVVEAKGERQALKLLREMPLDVLHTHGLRPTFLALRLGRRPWVRTAHSLLASDYASLLKRLPAEALERPALARADLTIANSEAVAAERIRLGADAGRVVVIPNGVAEPPPGADRLAWTEEFGLPSDARVALMLARLEPVKGVDRAVAALAALPPCWHLVVFGDGSQRSALEDLADRLRVGGRVHLLPYARDARRLLPAADVVVIPSRAEGLSMVAIEAQAAGAPVAATRTGGLPEALGDAAAWAASGSPQDLAQAILEARERSRQLAEEGRRRYRALFRPEVFGERTAAALRRAGEISTGGNYFNP